jgi:hypothetical protein
MADKYTPVTFNAGAPLDPQKLMDMQSNITSLVVDVNKLSNTTLDQQYTIVNDAGSFMTDDLKVGTPYLLEVPYSSSFTGVPRIISSIGSSLGSSEIVTTAIANASTKPTIQVWTNKNRGPVRVNWMAFEKK